ncbi:MAG TPA: creatininase family protein [Candidatus Binatia bacterium]|nr:creatininase family protein [Candidatus Binatia bacterium]
MSRAGRGGAGGGSGLRLLEARVDGATSALASALAEVRPAVAAAAADAAREDAGRTRRVVATGAGSSAAHARFLASVLVELGVPARFAPLTCFLGEAPPGAAEETLVVFSQGLAPNARLALAHAGAFRTAWLVTSVVDDPAAGDAPSGDRRLASAGDAPGDPASIAERRSFLALARERGLRVLRTPGGDEYGALLRVVGPMVGYATALALARSFAGEPTALDVPSDAICAAVADAGRRAAALADELPRAALEAPLAFLASGAHVERVANLPLKVLEGMLRPQPPVWDLLDFAHGPFQQSWGGTATFLALLRNDAPREDELLARLEGVLDRARHRVVRLRAELPGPLAILEHEAMMNALVLADVRARDLDPTAWPGKGADRPLYEIGAEAALPERRARSAPSSAPAVLERLTWPEVEQAIARGATAVLALGSTEQHGPHLPLATDTWIATELARRLCRRVAGAIALPTLALGCASEHLGFPGTLSVAEPTLVAILADLAASLERHGVARLFVFTAHGGNAGALGRAGPAMRERAGRMRVACVAGLPPMADVLHRASARFGVAPDAAGHHAGELETSIVLHLAPDDVRRERFAPGLLDVGADPSATFYPDLRRHASDGTVGDPRGADPARAPAYLDAWVDWLVDVYERDATWK